MIHKIFPLGPLQCNCSILGDEQTHEAMVIDPGDQIEGILEVLRQEKLTLKQIVITHAHIDHVGGAMKLKAATGCAYSDEPKRLCPAKNAGYASNMGRHEAAGSSPGG